MKVCFVTCHYPPLSRTYRRYQFARLLRDGGCEIEVVAHGNVSRAMGAFVDDPDMLEDDPEIPVHRVPTFSWHLLGEVLYRCGIIPCPHLNWLRPAVRKGMEIVRSPQDVVVSVHPPITDHLVAMRIARRTGARLVVDFRDEYLGLARGARRFWARRVEEKVVMSADLISVATPAVGEMLRERYGLSGDRIHLTENGYWEEVEGELELPDAGRIRLVYAGALSATQGLEILCRGVDLLRQQSPELAAKLDVVIYGPDNYYLRNRLIPAFPEGVHYGGFLRAGLVSGELSKADICFLSLSSDSYAYAIPGKLYEYIAHARPILAALPEGSARRLIEKEGFGLVADCGDAGGLALLIERMLDREKRAEFHRRLLDKRDQYAARPHFLSLARKIREL